VAVAFEDHLLNFPDHPPLTSGRFMATPEFVDARLTEKRNPNTTRIDVSSALEIVDLMNAEDRGVVEVVHGLREEIARCVDLMVDCFERGGRLVYVGAGTSGRLGVLDAAECPPTFGSPPEMVVGIIAGGTEALTRSQEGAEDDGAAGASAMDACGVGGLDFVLGIAASGTTPYVHEAVRRAQHLGARTGILSCSEPPADLASSCDVMLTAMVGPEVLTGSTRLKAGTATKLILNALTTGAMIRLGKAYGNLMVDLRTMSEKLVDRGERIVMEVAGCSRERARQTIQDANGSVKVAIVMAKLDTSYDDAIERLESAGGLVRKVAGDPPPVT